MNKNRDTNAAGDEGNALLEAIRQRLNESGQLSKIGCELRATILKDIRDGDKSPLNKSSSKSTSSPTQTANHLIMEYLDWMGYQYTKNMLATESGCGNALSLDSLEGKIDGSDKEMPLLLTMTAKLMDNKEVKWFKDDSS